MKTSDFDYELPENLIAQFPTQKRSESKMLVLDKSKQSLEHKHFYDIVDYLTDNDILVLNNTKVIPARLFGKKETGAKIEVFLLKDLKNGRWEVLMKPAKRVHLNDKIKISDELSVIAKEQMEDGKRIVEIVCEGDIYDLLNKYGNIPLPPYIERKMTSAEIKKLDYNRYQTVYAKNEGSVAAPTAGLHFTEEILQKLKNKGVTVCYVTLNVGLGTFRPVKCDDVTEHKMDSEEFEISEETAKIITEGKANGKNIVAGIRPEALTTDDIDGIQIDVKVDIVEMLGSEKIVYFYINGQKCSAKLSSNFDVKENVSLKFNPKDIFFFDKETGERV